MPRTRKPRLSAQGCCKKEHRPTSSFRIGARAVTAPLTRERSHLLGSQGLWAEAAS